MGDSKIAEIRARWAAATPGPWHADCQPGDCVVWGPSGKGDGVSHHVKEVFLCNVDNGTSAPVAFDLERENAVAIGAAPADIAFLLKQADELATIREKVRTKIRENNASIARMAEEHVDATTHDYFNEMLDAEHQSKNLAELVGITDEPITESPAKSYWLSLGTPPSEPEETDDA